MHLFSILFLLFSLVIAANDKPKDKPNVQANGEYKNILNIKRMLAAVNKEREQYKLNPLCLSDKLIESALGQAKYMASTGKLTHDDGRNVAERFKAFSGSAKGENVGETSNKRISFVMELFKKSKNHYCNMLGKYTHFGAALLPKDPSKPNVGPFYWAQHYGLNTSESGEVCVQDTKYVAPVESPEAKAKCP